MATKTKETKTPKPCRVCDKPASKCGYTEKRIAISDWICRECIRERAHKLAAAKGRTPRPRKAATAARKAAPAPAAARKAPAAPKAKPEAKTAEQKRAAKAEAQKRYRNKKKAAAATPAKAEQAEAGASA